MLLSTSILSGEEGAAAANFGSGGGGGGDFEFGVDPNLDPELALVCLLGVGIRNMCVLISFYQALRISLEEEKARQEAEAAKQGGGGDDKAQGESSTSGGDKMAVDSKPSQGDSAAHDTEDAELQAALAMSMQDKQGSSAQASVFYLNKNKCVNK